MRHLLAVLSLALSLALVSGPGTARDAPHKALRNAPAAAQHDKGARLRNMQRLQSKHDLRRIYHDRRPRRHMRSL